MAVSESYKDYVLDQLQPMGYVTIKKMFGGAGIYYDGLIFGLLADDVLYFKVDDSNRPDYEKEGMGPFKPFADKLMVMPYHEVPIDILEDRHVLLEWARKACIASKNSMPTGKKAKRKKIAP